MLSKSKIAPAAGIILGAAFAISTSSGALAETLEERDSCMHDALRFCQSAIPDRDRVFGCLVENRDQISSACHTMMAPYLPAGVPPPKKPAKRAHTGLLPRARSPKPTSSGVLATGNGGRSQA